MFGEARESTHSSQQHRVPMVVQELPLSLGERADIHNTLRLDTHSVSGRLVCDRRHNQSAGIFETDEPAIEKVIDTRLNRRHSRHETLVIAGISHGLQWLARR